MPRSASFPSGALADVAGGCAVSLTFDLDWTLSYGPEFDAIMGDRSVPSDNQAMRDADPKVSEIAVGIPSSRETIGWCGSEAPETQSLPTFAYARARVTEFQCTVEAVTRAVGRRSPVSPRKAGTQ